MHFMKFYHIRKHMRKEANFPPLYSPVPLSAHPTLDKRQLCPPVHCAALGPMRRACSVQHCRLCASCFQGGKTQTWGPLST